MDIDTEIDSSAAKPEKQVATVQENHEPASISPEETFNPEVGFFASAFEKVGENRKIMEILTAIQTGKWRKEIIGLRSHPVDSPAYTKIKGRLPAFLISASTDGGKNIPNLRSHSGMLQLDFDKIGESASELRDRLASDPHILAAWISPGGQGVKAIIRVAVDLNKVDLIQHSRAFKGAREYIKEKYQVDIDKLCSNVNRLCYVGYDEGLKMNSTATDLPVSPSAGQKTSEKAGLVKYSPELLNSVAVPTSVAVTTSASVYCITAESYFGKRQSLKEIYDQHVGKPFEEVHRGNRNAAIIGIVTNLFSKIHVDLIIELTELYRTLNKVVFDDYPESNFKREMLCHLENLEQNYIDELPPDAKNKYLKLPDEIHKSAFKICDSLSKNLPADTESSSPETTPPYFFLSMKHLADRLGLFAPQAQRILTSFRSNGIIELVKKGQAYQEGIKAAAGTYKWLL